MEQPHAVFLWGMAPLLFMRLISKVQLQENLRQPRAQVAVVRNLSALGPGLQTGTRWLESP